MMDSSATLSGRAPKQCDDSNFPAKKNSLSHRKPSFSSSLSSCSSSLGSLYFRDESSVNPETPLKFSGVPFSWESLPGIPKKNTHNKKDYLLKQLPLPPTSTPFNLEKEHFRTKKNISPGNFKKDPFTAALVECSKDDDDDGQDSSSRNNFFNGAKVTRSTGDRFGFINIYTSCKKTCAVSESLVYLPRSTRTSYDLIHHHHDYRSRGNP